jgi:hypothetical protein
MIDTINHSQSVFESWKYQAAAMTMALMATWMRMLAWVFNAWAMPEMAKAKLLRREVLAMVWVQFLKTCVRFGISAFQVTKPCGYLLKKWEKTRRRWQPRQSMKLKSFSPKRIQKRFLKKLILEKLWARKFGDHHPISVIPNPRIAERSPCEVSARDLESRYRQVYGLRGYRAFGVVCMRWFTQNFCFWSNR